MDELELESVLRETLRRREPRPAAVAQILATAHRQRRSLSLRRWGALAASLLIGLGLGIAYWRTRETPQQRAAREAALQLQNALQISSRKVAQLEAKLVVTVNSGVDLRLAPPTQMN